jgi:uncharacterized protein YeaO (DUF488 family)
MPIAIKRVYDPPAAGDGLRVLVDRLWPRGLSKAKARLGEWVKDVAPSDGLRKWFGHDPAKWAEFRKRYRAELKENPETLAGLSTHARDRRQITLLYAAKDDRHNNAVVLAEHLAHAGRRKRSRSTKRPTKTSAVRRSS